MLKSILKFSLLTLICVIIFAVVSFGLLIYINAQDTFASANTQQLERWSAQDTIDDSQNAFIAAIKFVGTQQHPKPIAFDDKQLSLLNDYSQLCHQAHLLTEKPKTDESNQFSSAVKISSGQESIKQVSRVTPQAEFTEQINKSVEQCSKFLTTHQVAIKALTQQYQAEVFRFKSILNMTAWQEAYKYDTERPLLNFTTLIRLQQLSELTALNHPQWERADAVISNLEDSYRFWFMVYQSANFLDTFALATSQLTNNINFGFLLLSWPEFSHIKPLDTWRNNTYVHEDMVKQVLSGEYMFGKNMINFLIKNQHSADEFDYYFHLFLSWFFKKNDSLNMNSDWLMLQYAKINQRLPIYNSVEAKTLVNTQMATAAQASADAEVKLAQENFQTKYAFCGSMTGMEQLWEMMYNPVGKTLGCSQGDLTHYFDNANKLYRMQKRAYRYISEKHQVFSQGGKR